MYKREKRLICSFEILLLIISSFAVAFVLSNNSVSAAPTDDLILGPRAPQPPTAINPTQAASFWTIDAGKEIAGGTYYSGAITDGTNVWQIASADKPLTVSYSGGKTIVAHEDKFFTLKEGTTLTTQTAVQGDLGTKANLGIWKPEINIFGSQAGNFFVAHLFEGVVWGAVLALAVKYIGPLVGLSEEQSNAAAIAAFGGVVSAKIAYGVFGPSGALSNTPFFSTVFGTVPGAFITGGLIAAVIFIALYKKESKDIVVFQCLPFEPPLGGGHCEECNKDPFRPCSEYRCRSLGQACEIVNAGTLEEKCVWVNPKDVNSPTIEPWAAVLKPKGLAYVPDTTIRPPNRGVKIVSSGANGCLQAFTPLEFGVTTNEPAQCKIDYDLANSFATMKYFFGDTNYYLYNHTQKMKLPGPDDTKSDVIPKLENDGTFSLYARCQDKNGNENVDAFVFSFCVDPSPDTTPPLIEGTSIVNNGFVRFNADQTPIEVYTNEPSECKWSRTSKDYDSMENSMTCGTESFQINADLNYVCVGNLTGINDKEDNKFYFRCKDQPGKQESERFVMTQSYELTLKGTEELNILNVGPNGTISGSSDVVPVLLRARTDDGAEEGKSICYISNTGLTDSYIAMSDTNNFEHSQSLDLIAGNYKYYFRCIDSGGNTAEENVSFSVFVDKQAPKVTRAYREDGLKVVTNEDAQCVYSLNSCNYVFDEGLPLIYNNPLSKRNHFAEWKANSVYYIKCADLKGNEPSPNACSIVVNSVELK